MTLRLFALIVAGAVALAGCGDDSASREPLIVPAPPCPAGTPEIGLRDVLRDLPAGLAVFRADRKQFAPLVTTMRAALGDTLVSVKTGVVAEEGRRFGTGVVVMNTKTSNVDPQPDPTGRRQPITIAGEPGLLEVREDGARASGNVGTCAAVLIEAPDERWARRVAALIRQPD